ncbi:hypothetical protein B0H19DRAFT_1263949 [Mycena capillaripes]|nr:hypothetical protein B0H19DRAFT_1263949 [Mycena capillaripes]
MFLPTAEHVPTSRAFPRPSRTSELPTLGTILRHRGSDVERRVSARRVSPSPLTVVYTRPSSHRAPAGRLAAQSLPLQWADKVCAFAVRKCAGTYVLPHPAPRALLDTLTDSALALTVRLSRAHAVPRAALCSEPRDGADLFGRRNSFHLFFLGCYFVVRGSVACVDARSSRTSRCVSIPHLHMLLPCFDRALLDSGGIPVPFMAHITTAYFHACLWSLSGQTLRRRWVGGDMDEGGVYNNPHLPPLRRPALARLATLSCAPSLHMLLTPLPALWAPAYVGVAVNAALERICLGDELGSSAALLLSLSFERDLDIDVGSRLWHSVAPPPTPPYLCHLLPHPDSPCAPNPPDYALPLRRARHARLAELSWPCIRLRLDSRFASRRPEPPSVVRLYHRRIALIPSTTHSPILLGMCAFAMRKCLGMYVFPHPASRALLDALAEARQSPASWSLSAQAWLRQWVGGDADEGENPHDKYYALAYPARLRLTSNVLPALVANRAPLDLDPLASPDRHPFLSSPCLSTFDTLKAHALCFSREALLPTSISPPRDSGPCLSSVDPLRSSSFWLRPVE